MTDKAQIGLIGLGTMGAALALNIAEKGFPIAVWNRTTSVTHRFKAEAAALADRVIATETLAQLVAAIQPPRAIILMVPAGQPVDDQLEALSPLLDAEDLVIDAGNADFRDTDRRAAAGLPFHFLGMGVSGGEEGARHGPSIMGGGTQADWDRVAPILTAISAKAEDGTPCAARMGDAGAGHFVKMVHNGIEYADMQMIAEVYGLLRDAGGQTAPQIGALFESWQKGPLSSYLIEVSAAALQTVDAESGTPMVDLILDKAGQKGTGRWTLIEALKLGQSASSIEAAVGARGWSSEKALRVAAAPLLPDAVTGGTLPTEDEMKSALLAARILGHAQGFRVLSAASDEFGWQLDMARIAEIWRAGCIIRSALLDDLADAFHAGLPEGALILAPAIRDMLGDHLAGLRKTVAAGVSLGVPMPALSASLAWYDSIRTARGSANLIQAQRDFFGAHGFERGDIAGAHHGTWNAIRRD